MSTSPANQRNILKRSNLVLSEAGDGSSKGVSSSASLSTHREPAALSSPVQTQPITLQSRPPHGQSSFNPKPNQSTLASSFGRYSNDSKKPKLTNPFQVLAEQPTCNSLTTGGRFSSNAVASSAAGSSFLKPSKLDWNAHSMFKAVESKSNSSSNPSNPSVSSETSSISINPSNKFLSLTTAPSILNKDKDHSSSSSSKSNNLIDNSNGSSDGDGGECSKNDNVHQLQPTTTTSITSQKLVAAADPIANESKEESVSASSTTTGSESCDQSGSRKPNSCDVASGDGVVADGDVISCAAVGSDSKVNDGCDDKAATIVASSTDVSSSSAVIFGSTSFVSSGFTFGSNLQDRVCGVVSKDENYNGSCGDQTQNGVSTSNSDENGLNNENGGGGEGSSETNQGKSETKLNESTSTSATFNNSSSVMFSSVANGNTTFERGCFGAIGSTGPNSTAAASNSLFSNFTTSAAAAAAAGFANNSTNNQNDAKWSSNFNGPLLSTSTSSRSVPTKLQTQVKTGEENERTIFQMQAKLFQYDVSVRNWKERGRGVLKVNTECNKNNSNSQLSFKDTFYTPPTHLNTRIVMRTNATYQLVLNTKLFVGQVLEKASDRAIKLSCLDGEKSGMTLYTIKGDAQNIDNLYNQLNRIREAMTEEKGVKEEENKPKLQSGSQSGIGHEVDKTSGVEGDKDSTTKSKEEENNEGPKDRGAQNADVDEDNVDTSSNSL